MVVPNKTEFLFPQVKLSETKDARIKLMNEVLNGIKVNISPFDKTNLLYLEEEYGPWRKVKKSQQFIDFVLHVEWYLFLCKQIS